ncbi:hypothetical protein SAMN06298212_10666 [Ruaniaceae bacterium KH17]|nr:hypothetical protein SAMN06298212_10666 [Ruaniaceae bacterium KH17]
MRHTPHFLMTDPAEVKRLIQRSPWTKLSQNKASDVVGRITGEFDGRNPALAEDLCRFQKPA